MRFDVSQKMKDAGFVYRETTDSEKLQKAKEICEFHKILHGQGPEELKIGVKEAEG